MDRCIKAIVMPDYSMSHDSSSATNNQPFKHSSGLVWDANTGTGTVSWYNKIQQSSTSPSADITGHNTGTRITGGVQNKPYQIK